MSNVLYEASPSMVRMNPFGTLLVIVLILFGIYLAAAGGPLLAALPIPAGSEKIAGVIGIVLVVIGFVRLLSWWVITKLDRLVIKEGEIIWTHGLLNKQYTEISMGSIRTVRVNQGFLQRIMDAGDVSIYTSGDIPEL
ncbi:MAG: PH domain-containing protein, partial [Chromatiaceae bacterium]|nr:PH domain-containing protein [Chromatiaceae bacterium]